MVIKKADNSRNFLELSAQVRKRGLEPPHLAELPPEDSASTNFATCAYISLTQLLWDCKYTTLNQ